MGLLFHMSPEDLTDAELRRLRIKLDISEQLMVLYRERWEDACRRYPDLKPKGNPPPFTPQVQP